MDWISGPHQVISQFKLLKCAKALTAFKLTSLANARKCARTSLFLSFQKLGKLHGPTLTGDKNTGIRFWPDTMKLTLY